MQCALLVLSGGSRGLLCEGQQARLVQQVRHEHQQGLLGTQDFANQDQAQ
jgi:hypothetical protein